MSAQLMPNDSLRRCVLLTPHGGLADTVAKLLIDRGVECMWPQDLLPAGTAWSDELTHHLIGTDFVVAVVPPSAAAQVAFELGLAHGLNKPALVIAAGKAVVPSDLHGVVVVRIPDFDHLPDAVPEIDRFLRHAKRAMPAGHPVAPQEHRDLDWARSRLETLRADSGARQGLEFERLVADVFARGGAEVQLTNDSPSANDDGIDLVVWLDDLANEVGGPMLVECKFYGGGVGSIVRNAEHTIRRLDDVVRRSDARLAFLVFDHARMRPTPPLNETTRVLAFPIDRLLDALERGTLADEVFKRRERAAYARGRSGVDHVQ